MMLADQEVRERWRLHPQDEQAGAAVGAEDRKSRARLQAIVLAHGWPGHGLVGVDGAHAAWLLVQHQDADRPFQRLCLERLADAVARHDASPTDLAYLTDRVLVAEGRRQRFGTQFRQGPGGVLEPSPIEDPARVDERRRDAGCPPWRSTPGDSARFTASHPLPRVLGQRQADEVAVAQAADVLEVALHSFLAGGLPDAGHDHVEGVVAGNLVVPLHLDLADRHVAWGGHR